MLGVESVRFLDFSDGQLVADMQMRECIVRLIREMRPDIVVSSDPTNYFPSHDYINHPDHRAAGLAVIEAANPAAHIPHYFPEQIQAGLQPHRVQEVWLALTAQPNVVIDVSEYWGQKVAALLKHASQVGDPLEFQSAVLEWRTPDSTAESPRYTEEFRRFVF